MSFDLYTNSGGIFTVIDTLVIPENLSHIYPNSALQLAPWSAPATWINGQNYINPNWEAHYSGDHPYGWFNALTSRDTKNNHQYNVNKILENGAFIWGDIYGGGLYIYKSYSNSYGLALFYGYGADEDEPNYDIFFINHQNVMEHYTLAQIETISLSNYYELDENKGWTNSTRFHLIVGGTPTEGGHSYTKEGSIQLDDDEPYRDLNYIFSNVPTPISETLITYPDYVVIKPLNPLKANWQAPKEIWMVSQVSSGSVDNFYVFSPTFGAPSTPTLSGYNTSGSWAGGESNYVPSDPNSGNVNPSGGGYGSPSKQSDDVGLPDDTQFNVDAVNSGFVTIFHPTAANMTAFNRWLWSSFTESWWDSLKKILQDPLDFVISAAMVKYVPDSIGYSEIKFNGIGTGVFANLCNQWEKLDFGSIRMSEQFNSYLDYGSYSSAKIHLPFIGIKQLEMNDIQNSLLHLIYYIDNLTGTCIAHLNIDREDRGAIDDSHVNSVLYKFTGSCRQELPLSNKDYTQSISAVLNLISGSSNSIGSSSGNAGVAAINMTAAAANTAMQMKPNIERSGNLSSNFGLMDSLTPYLILERPIRGAAAGFGSFVGYPASNALPLKQYRGFIKCVTAKLENIHATDDEKEMIMELLTSGVYYKED